MRPKRIFELQLGEINQEKNSIKIAVCVHDHPLSIISSTTTGLDSSKVSAVEDMEISKTESEGSRTELDLHVNITVVVNQTFIL